MDLMNTAREFVMGLPDGLQGLGVFLVSFIPFVEGEGAGLIGVVVGVHPWVAIPAAVLGNLLAVALLVYAAHGVRSAATARRGVAADAGVPATGHGTPVAERNVHLRRRFEAWGVPGLSLLGPWFLIPGHVAAPAMVSFGANRHRVMAWQAVAIVLYTALTACVAFGLVSWSGVREATPGTF